MNKQRLFCKLRSEVASVTPDVKEIIMNTPVVVAPKVEQSKVFFHLAPAMVAVSCAIMLSIGAVGVYATTQIPNSLITIDVNPSVQLITNLNDQVLDVKALNEDAIAIVKNIDKKGSVDQVVNQVIDNLIAGKYITAEDENDILISVSNKNEKKTNTLKESIAGNIGSYLKAQAIDATLVTQNVDKKAAIASKNEGVSFGKSNLVRSLVPLLDGYSEEQLMQMPVKQLVALAKKAAENRNQIIKDLMHVDILKTIKITDADKAAIDAMIKAEINSKSLTAETMGKLLQYINTNKLSIDALEDYLEANYGKDFDVEDHYEKVFGDNDDDADDDIDDIEDDGDDAEDELDDDDKPVSIKKELKPSITKDKNDNEVAKDQDHADDQEDDNDDADDHDDNEEPDDKDDENSDDD